MFDIIGLLKNLFGFGQSAVDYQSKKLDLKNTEQMQAAAQRQDEARAKDVTNAAIAKGDVDEIRKEIAE
jgi:hypothetical protein